jgi:hypothetical protein
VDVASYIVADFGEQGVFWEIFNIGVDAGNGVNLVLDPVPPAQPPQPPLPPTVNTLAFESSGMPMNDLVFISDVVIWFKEAKH